MTANQPDRRPWRLAAAGVLLLTGGLIETWLALGAGALSSTALFGSVAIAAAGLVVPRLRRAASLGLAVLLVTASASRLSELLDGDGALPPPVAAAAGGSEDWRLAISGNWRHLRDVPTLESAPAGGPLRVRVPRITAERIPWHVRVSRGGFSLERGAPYLMRLRARAARPRIATVSITLADEADGPSLLYQELPLDVGWREFHWTFESARGGSGVVTLNVGQSATDVEFEPPSLVPITGESHELLTWSLETHGDWRPEQLPRLEWPVTPPRRMSIRFAETLPAREPWSVQLNHHALAVLAEQTYTLRFEARAEAERPFCYGVARGRAPYDALGLYSCDRVSREWKSFAATFQATETESRARVLFDLGGATPGVDLREVVFVENGASPRSSSGSDGDVRAPAPEFSPPSSAKRWAALVWPPLALAILLWATRPWREDCRAFVETAGWLAGLYGGGIAILAFGMDVGGWVLTGLIGAAAGGTITLFGTRHVIDRAPRSPAGRRDSFLWGLGAANVVACLIVWFTRSSTGDLAALGTLLLPTALALALVSRVRRPPRESAATDGPPGRNAPWSTGATYWLTIAAAAAGLATIGLARNGSLTAAELGYILVNRFLTYAVVLGLIHVAARAVALNQAPGPRAAFSLAAAVLPPALVLDFLAVSQTGVGLAGWLPGLLEGEQAANFEQLLGWSGFGLADVAVYAGCGFGAGFVVMRLAAASGSRLDRRLPASRAIAAIVAMAAGVAAVETAVSDVLRPETEREFARACPLRLFRPAAGGLPVAFREPPAPDAARLAEVSPPPRKPDVFILVLDSLRTDAVTATVAPHLSAFRRDAWSAARTFAASHGSETSWYALLHSRHAFRWAGDRQDEQGAYPLRLLRRLGYRVEARLAGDHRWKNMANRLFGREHALADLFVDTTTFPQLNGMPHHERDRVLVGDLARTLRERPAGGYLYVQEFLSTHWTYDWPDDHLPPLDRWAPEVDFTKLSYTAEEVQLVRNRYLNAVSWVDRLFGDVLAALRATGRYEESLVVVVGDHGEDLYEEGRWAHGSDLCRHQTEVPILIRWPSFVDPPPERSIMGHVDVMPSVFDALEVDAGLLEPLEGRSAFEPRTSLLLSSTIMSSSSPGLVLVNETERAWLAYWASEDDGPPDRMRVQDRRDWNDLALALPRPANTRRWMERAFGDAIHQLLLPAGDGRESRHHREVGRHRSVQASALP